VWATGSARPALSVERRTELLRAGGVLGEDRDVIGADAEPIVHDAWEVYRPAHCGGDARSLRRPITELAAWQVAVGE
jgi:hypothetical protein